MPKTLKHRCSTVSAGQHPLPCHVFSLRINVTPKLKGVRKIGIVSFFIDRRDALIDRRDACPTVESKNGTAVLAVNL